MSDDKLPAGLRGWIRGLDPATLTVLEWLAWLIFVGALATYAGLL
jgi:hypothetical protein